MWGIKTLDGVWLEETNQWLNERWGVFYSSDTTAVWTKNQVTSCSDLRYNSSSWRSQSADTGDSLQKRQSHVTVSTLQCDYDTVWNFYFLFKPLDRSCPCRCAVAIETIRYSIYMSFKYKPVMCVCYGVTGAPSKRIHQWKDKKINIEKKKKRIQIKIRNNNRKI